MTLSMVVFSCDDELVDNSFNVENTLGLTVSHSEITLEELFVDNRLGFNWTSGTNSGTGAAIRYTLEIDREGNDFSEPIMTLLEGEKNVFSTSIDHGTLNNGLLENGMLAGAAQGLTAKITARFPNTSLQPQTATSTFTITPYKPVSTQLYIVGDATPVGWDITNAIELTASTVQRRVFIYEGSLVNGNFKFAVNTDDCFCQDFYTKDADDDSIIIFNEGGSGDDYQWTITEEGDYRITVDLLEKTIAIDKAETPKFDNLWIVGDATESGWNVDTPVAFTQHVENPFLFEYEGNFAPGEFKILAGSLGDFCGQWYRPFENGQAPTNGSVNQNSGCEADANWRVTEEMAGRYRISLNTADNTINFEAVLLYIIGDGGPNGWNIATPGPMSYDNGDFVYNGALGAENPTGEFKISKFKGDWCLGDWINPANPSQSISDTGFIFTVDCEGPDNKWQLQQGEAGDYEIRINLDTEVMTITKL